ncbi:MAG: hypothetical protein ACK4GL_10425 [Flavobacteriales bacterium]
MVKLLPLKNPYTYRIFQTPGNLLAVVSWIRAQYLLFFYLLISSIQDQGLFAQSIDSYIKLEYQLDISGVKTYELDELFRPFVDEQGGFFDVIFDESQKYFSVVIYGAAGKENCEKQLIKYGAQFERISEKEIAKTSIDNNRQLTFANQREKGLKREERFEKMVGEDGKEYYVFDKTWYESLPDVKKERISNSGLLFILKD